MAGHGPTLFQGLGQELRLRLLASRSFVSGVLLRYARFDGTTWHTETVYDGADRVVSLDLDRDGRPHISYYESYSNPAPPDPSPALAGSGNTGTHADLSLGKGISTDAA